MEEHHLGDQLLRRVNVYLEENSLKVSRGTIADTASINPPSSMKNKDKPRDSEMNQTRKRNQWYFGMKAHIGVNSKTKLIYAAAATAANVHDSQVPGDRCMAKRPGYGVIRHTRASRPLSRKKSLVRSTLRDKRNPQHALTSL